jgi:hypothetical protein
MCGYDGQLETVSVAVEAAHVRWWAYDGPDDLANGLALCSLHHRVFDHGVVTVETFTGSTERRALDELQTRGVEVRVSYDTQTTRLHAKSWVFHRRSGFSTAYVGSSNLTRTALLDGREWNVRISRAASPELFEKIATTFDAQWESGDYEPYDPDRFDVETRSRRTPDDGESALSGLELRPWPYQDEILDALEVERQVHGSTRNLVVARTGTGKTVVAALDYRQLRREHGDLSLLFVAHREQMLRQSRRTFREALGDGAFGEFLVGGHRPEDGRHVFASIQTLSSLGAGSTPPTTPGHCSSSNRSHGSSPTRGRCGHWASAPPSVTPTTWRACSTSSGGLRR